MRHTKKERSLRQEDPAATSNEAHSGECDRRHRDRHMAGAAASCAISPACHSMHSRGRPTTPRLPVAGARLARHQRRGPAPRLQREKQSIRFKKPLCGHLLQPPRCTSSASPAGALPEAQ